jgi:hypothetical protein
MTISPGHHLYRRPDGQWRGAGPADRFVRIGGPDDVLERAQRLLHTGDGDPDAPGLRAVLDGLERRGVRSPATAPSEPVRERFVVGIDGHGPIADHVGALLADTADVRRADGATIEGLDLLVSCAGWLPDTSWQTLDDACRRQGMPWHTTYAEGDTIVVGPLSVPGRTAGYRDVRGRRLAAAAFPDELLGLWAYLGDGDQPTPPVPPVDTATAAVVAGFVAADVAALLAGRSWPSEGYQLVVVPGRAEVRRHRVLPLPAFAPVEPVR